MDVTSIKGEFKWSEAEFVTLNSVALRHSKNRGGTNGSAYGWGVFVIIFGFIIIIIHGWWSAGPVFIFLGTMMLLLPLYFIPNFLRKQYAQRSDRDALVKWECNDRAIFSSWEKGSSQLEWSAISNALQTPQGFLLYINQSVHWFPTHSFHNPADIPRLSELVKSRVRDFQIVS